MQALGDTRVVLSTLTNAGATAPQGLGRIALGSRPDRCPADHDDPSVSDDDRAPICPFCGVTALPGDEGHVVDPRFVCENPDRVASGEIIPAP